MPIPRPPNRDIVSMVSSAKPLANQLVRRSYSDADFEENPKLARLAQTFYVNRALSRTFNPWRNRVTEEGALAKTIVSSAEPLADQLVKQAYDDADFKEDPELARLAQTINLSQTFNLWQNRVEEEGGLAKSPILTYSVDKATSDSTIHANEGITHVEEEHLPHHPAEKRARFMSFRIVLSRKRLSAILLKIPRRINETSKKFAKAMSFPKMAVANDSLRYIAKAQVQSNSSMAS
ncbi:hypothetical protein F4803DRAFT_531016 [Xylaria telfairii]|nr:hypothetical protein F4803DRAFT_531016 [Xylaria telfairii]